MVDFLTSMANSTGDTHKIHQCTSNDHMKSVLIGKILEKGDLEHLDVIYNDLYYLLVLASNPSTETSKKWKANSKSLKKNLQLSASHPKRGISKGAEFM